MKISRIVLIQPEGGKPVIATPLIMPRYGLPLIGTILRNNGYHAKVFVEHISGIPPMEEILKADAVCFSVLNYAAQKAYDLADRIRAKKKMPLIIGGSHASYLSESCLRHFDYVVRGEGDETILNLLDALENNRPMESVKGVSFKKEGRIIDNPMAPPPEDFSTIPDYSLIHKYGESPLFKKYSQIPIQFSRGCPLNCSFCIVRDMFGKSYRTRDVNNVVDDIEDKLKWGRHMMFVDNNFTANPNETKKLLRAILKRGIKAKFVIFSRIEAADNVELLALMRRAGVTHIFLGIESIDDNTLNQYNKRQTREKIERSLRILKENGLKIIPSFVVGSDNCHKNTVKEIVSFLLKNRIHLMAIFPIFLFPSMPGGKDYERRIFNDRWEYFSQNYVAYFPRRVRPSVLQKELVKGSFRISAQNLLGDIRKRSFIRAIIKMYYDFSTLLPYARECFFHYIPYLKKVESPFYDGDALVESRLEKRASTKPWP